MLDRVSYPSVSYVSWDKSSLLSVPHPSIDQPSVLMIVLIISIRWFLNLYLFAHIIMTFCL